MKKRKADSINSPILFAAGFFLGLFIKFLPLFLLLMLLFLVAGGFLKCFR